MLHVMDGASPVEPAPGSPEPRRPRTGGNWVGYLIFAFVLLCLPVLIFSNVQYADQRQWTDVVADVADWTVFILFFVTVPTGGAMWLCRVLKDRQSSKPVGRHRLSGQLGRRRATLVPHRERTGAH